MSCPLNVQTPFPGRFDQRDLRWVTTPLTAGPNKGLPVAEAYIPFERFNDFYEGECDRGDTTFHMVKREVQQAGSLQRPQHNSSNETYTCSFGPEDYRNCSPVLLTQKERPKDSRLGIRDEGTSRKRGYLSGFTATKLNLWPDVMQLSVRHSKHTGAAGKPVHGSYIPAQNVHNYAPVCQTT